PRWENDPGKLGADPVSLILRRSQQPFILEESPVDTMADQRTMAELLRARTEGSSGLKRIILKITSVAYQDSLNAAACGNLLERRTQDVLTIIENKSKVRNSRSKSVVSQVKACDVNSNYSSQIAKLTHAVNQLTSVVTTAMMAILKQFQATSHPASVKAVEETCVTCGGAHPYYQCLAAGGNTFSELRDNIQGYISAAAVNYNQGNPGYRPSGMANQIRPLGFTQPNVQNNQNRFGPPQGFNRGNNFNPEHSYQAPAPQNQNVHLNELEKVKRMNEANTKAMQTQIDMGELKAITTRSGLVIDGPTIPTPPQSINPEVDKRVEETFTDPDLAEYTIKLHINITLANALILMPKYQKMLKASRPTRRNFKNCELKCKALADLGASINLMPLSVWKKLDWERFSKIKHALTNKKYQPEEIQELMCKLLEDVRNIREELAEYINSPSWNYPAFYDDDEEHSVQYKEYLENSSNAIIPVLPTEEPEYSLSMGYEHLNTTPKTKSDKIIKSGVEKLVPIPSECEVTFVNESECDVPVCEDSSTFDVLKDHSEILSDSSNNDISSDGNAFEDVDINRLIADIEFLNDNPTPDRVLKSSYSFPIFEKSDNSHSYSNNSLPEFETFSDHTNETRSGSTTAHANNSLPEYDSFCFETEPDQGRLISVVMNDISDNSINDPLLEEVDLFLASDNSIPPGIENFGYDSEKDIHFLEELLVDDFILLPENESSYIDHHHDPSFPRLPPKPPNVEICFDFEPNSEEVISDELSEDECFDPGGAFDVLANVEDDDYFPFIFVIRIFLPYIIYPERRNRRRSQQPFILEESPVDTMADQRTMAELLRAPTERYAEAIVVPPILAEQFELKHSLINMMTSDQTTNLRNEILNFQQRFDESFHEAWNRYKDLLRACSHHGFTELHQLDTFYNALNPTYQDSLNAAAGGNFLERRTQDVLIIIENKSKVCNSRSKSVVSQVKACDVNSNSLSEIAKLTHAVNQQTSVVTTAMTAILKQFQATPPPAFVKAVEETCVTCGAAINYNQGNPGYRPPGMAIQIRPPDFAQPHVKNNQNRFGPPQGFNRGNNFNPEHAYQAPAPQNQNVHLNELEKVKRMNEANIKAMQTQIDMVKNKLRNEMKNSIQTSLSNQTNEIKNLMASLLQMNTASTSGSGSLPSNTVANPNGELKSITTRSGLVIDGPIVPTPPQSINPEVDERVEETFTDPDLAEYTIKKMLKALMSNKEKLQELANTPVNENCSAVILKELPEKLGDSWKFLIPCGFSELKCKALADLGASINLIPLSVWKKLEHNRPIFFDDNEDHSVQYKDNLENSSKEIAASNSNQEKEKPPQDSDIRKLIREECCLEVCEEQKQNMEDTILELEHPNTTPETESNEIIKSGVEELVPILSENEVTLEDKRECDMPVCENSLVCNDHSEIFSDSNNDDDILSDENAFEDIEYVEASLPNPEIVRLEEENVVHQEEEEFDLEEIQDVILHEKLLSINCLIANIESLNDNHTPDCVLNSSISFPISEESDNSLSNNFSPEFETFCDHMEETRSGNTTTHVDDSLLEYDLFCFVIEPDQERLINDILDDSLNDPLLEEADLFLALDNSIPPGIENFADDSEGDIRFLEELLIDDSILFPDSESSGSDFDNLSFLRPPPKPLDDEFDFEPDTGEEILVVMNNDELECLYPRDEFDDDDYSSFMFVIYPKVFSFLLSTESEDTIFDPGISV
nr:hypothetical protein [Tanacetum cinerariifolium]